MTIFISKHDGDLKDELKNDYPKQWQKIYKELRNLRTMLVTSMRDNCNDATVDIWEQIDATQPMKDINAISYRYPFVDSKTSEGIAPANYTDWSTYQGDEAKVKDAIIELIKRTKTQINIYNRSP